MTEAPSRSRSTAQDPITRTHLFLASRVSPVSFPEQTHGDPERIDSLLFGYKPWVTVSDAIGDLPNPILGPADELGGGPLELYLTRPSLSEFARDMRSQVSFPYNHP